MLELKSIPFVKIGDSGGTCSENLINVPDICSECRQLTRWTNKALSWAKGSDTRIGRIFRAMLQADDDMLKSLCGFCFLQDESTMTDAQICECLVQKYTSLGLSLTVPVNTTEQCDYIFEEVNIDSCGASKCWLVECGPNCDDCVPRVLDPCNSADDRAIVEGVLAAKQVQARNIRSGPALIEALTNLFPASAPQVVRVQGGFIDVWIGRAMTPAEFQLRGFFKSLLPVSNDATVRFLYEC